MCIKRKLIRTVKIEEIRKSLSNHNQQNLRTVDSVHWGTVLTMKLVQWGTKSRERQWTTRVCSFYFSYISCIDHFDPEQRMHVSIQILSASESASAANYYSYLIAFQITHPQILPIYRSSGCPGPTPFFGLRWPRTQIQGKIKLLHWTYSSSLFDT